MWLRKYFANYMRLSGILKEIIDAFLTKPQDRALLDLAQKVAAE